MILIFLSSCVFVTGVWGFKDGFNVALQDTNSEFDTAKTGDSSYFSFSRSRLQLRNASTAKLIDSTKGKTVPITYETDFWFDIKKLKEKKKIGTFDKLCVQGVWLVYDKTDFQANSKLEVGVVSGEDSCVDLKSYGKIQSIQPITPLSTRKVNALAFFPERNFNGAVWSLDSNHSDGTMGHIPKSNSLIIIGNSSWTLFPASGHPVCISPRGGAAMKFPICFVSKLIEGKKIKTGSFLKIKIGCENSSKKMNIHFCTDYYTGKLQRIENVAHDIKGRGTLDEPEEDTEDDPQPIVPPASKTEKKPNKPEVKLDKAGCPVPLTDQLDKEGKALLEIRLSRDLMSDTNYGWPNAYSDIWKLELLERVFSVVFATIPNDLVPISYLRLVREIFVYLWDTKGDKKGNQTSKSFTDFEWMKLNSYLDECTDAVIMDEEESNVANVVDYYYSQLDNPEEVEYLLDDMFYLNPDFDPVIETVWVVANHVAATCHHALRFPPDFWTNFIHIFQEMYLKRVEKQWATPGKLPNAYKFIFGGFGMKAMYSKLALAATLSVEEIDDVIYPFVRLMDANQIFGQTRNDTKV